MTQATGRSPGLFTRRLDSLKIAGPKNSAGFQACDHAIDEKLGSDPEVSCVSRTNRIRRVDDTRLRIVL